MNDMRIDPREAAQHLAAKGRFGDSMLIHVSPAEVQGIASLIPGGLTVNPETGLPEAFFFLPFLASLFGAAAPAATAAAAAAPAIASTLGTAATTAATTAAGAGTAAATGLGSLGTSLASLPSTIAHGIGSMFGGGAAAAAPAIDPVITGSTAAALPAASAPLASSPTLMSALTPVPPVAPATATHAISDLAPKIFTPLHPVIATPTGTGASVAGQSFAGTGTATAGPAAVTPVAATPMAQTASSLGDMGKGALGWMAKNPMLALGGISALGSMFKGSGKPKKEKERDPNSLPKYSGGSPVFPGSDYIGGHSGEWNYFPNYGYANGGIVSLANGGPVDPQMQQPQDQSFPLNGVPGTDEAPPDIPSSSYPASQIGTPPEPPPQDTANEAMLNDHELIAQAVKALKGQSSDPRPVLLAFMKTFGEQALQDLATRVKSMDAQGAPPGGAPAGDGPSDSVPAMIDGQQPAALSQGEFVVPADAVSHLGNGSTDAGAQHLQGMVDNVRQSRTGTPTAPPRLNGGGLVSLV